MTRKLTRNYSLAVVASFMAILTLSIAAAVLAQTSGAGQTNASANTVLAPTRAFTSAQTERPLTPWTDGTGRFPLSRSQAKQRGGCSMDGDLFLPGLLYGVGPVEWVTVADVNGDGKPDLLEANGNSTVSVLLGNGDGTFQPPVTYGSGGVGAQSIAVADVNGDGKPDLVVANWYASEPDTGNGTLGVLLGNGDGTFQTAVPYDAGAQGANSVAIADLRGNGKADLLVANLWGVVGVLLGNGDGTFQAVVTYDPGGIQPNSITVADVNGDRKPDLLVANGCPKICPGDGLVGVLLGNGDGTFQTAVTYDAGGGDATSIVVADVNLDGKPDVVVADYYSGTVGVLLGNGNGTFQPAVTYPAGSGQGRGPFMIAVADINGDDKPDLAVAIYAYGPVNVLLGNGDGTFQAPVGYNQVGTELNAVALADVNGDGRPDLLAATTAGVAVLLNNSGASPTVTSLLSSLNPSGFEQSVTFTAAVSSASGTPTGSVIFYDASTQIGSATLASGRASISTSSLVAGSHSITAAYQGAYGFGTSSSAPLNQIVNPASTTTSLASSENPAPVKHGVTYTATVTNQNGAALTGTVTFQDSGATIATVPLSNNKAAYSTSYPDAGVHLITATYSGDPNYAGSVSSVLTQDIGNPPFSSDTALATSGSPSQFGQPVTFRATVSSIHGTIPDGGLVTFYDGVTEIGTGTTTGGAATFTTSLLTAKRHTIKASYAGDAQFKPSTGKVTQVVDK